MFFVQLSPQVYIYICEREREKGGGRETQKKVVSVRVSDDLIQCTSLLGILRECP